MRIIEQRKSGPMYSEQVRFSFPKKAEQVGSVIANGIGFFGKARLFDGNGKLVCRGFLKQVRSKDMGNPTRITVFKPWLWFRKLKNVVVSEKRLSKF